MMGSSEKGNFGVRNTTQSNKLVRSSSTKEASFSEFPYTPPRRSSPSLHASPISSPLHQVCVNKKDNGEAAYRCVSSVLKKDGQILSIAASNGLVYTGSDINVIRVWKLPEFSECGQLKTKASMVVAIQVSHDRVYAAYGDAKIRVWQRTWDDLGLKHVRLATIPRTASVVRTYISGKDNKLTKHMGAITSVAMNVSEDILYTGSVDKTVKVWRISDMKCIETIEAHPEAVNDLVVADDGVLFTASDDATVKVWRRNFCRGDQPHSLTVTLPAKYSPVKALTLTHDGAVLYGGCTDGYVHYWLKGWYSGQLQYGGSLQGHTHAVMSLSTSSNYLVTASADSTTRVWARDTTESTQQHTCLAVLVGHRGPVRCVTAIDHNSEQDSCTICTGSLDGVLKVWRLTCNLNRSSTPTSSDYFQL